jgi:hypothetical protein
MYTASAERSLDNPFCRTSRIMLSASPIMVPRYFFSA